MMPFKFPDFVGSDTLTQKERFYCSVMASRRRNIELGIGGPALYNCPIGDPRQFEVEANREAIGRYFVDEAQTLLARKLIEQGVEA